MAYSPRQQDILEQSHRSIEAGKGIEHDEFWKAVEQRRAKKVKSGKPPR
jgi:hypothetical protein